MSLELKRPGVSPPEKIIVTDFKYINSSSGWDILLRCPNNQAHNHNDDHWSCRGNESEKRVHCPVCQFGAVFWDNDKAHGGNNMGQKTSKRLLQEAKEKEMKSNIFAGIDIDIENWSGYDDKIKEEVRIRLPYDLCSLPEDERTIVMRSIVEAGIFRISELRTRVKRTNQMLEKQKESVKEKKRGKKKIILTKGWFPELINLIKIDGVVHYLLDDKDNKLYTAKTIEIGDNEFKPKQDLPIEYPTKKILELSREIDFSLLLKAVERFIRRYLEMPDESSYFLIALWVFHTYIADREFLTPYLFFYGAFGTGKSQAGDILKHLAYKAETITDVTSASLFRGIQYYRNTLLFDEIKLWGYGSNPDIVSIILSGYQRKDAVPRVDMNEKKDVEDQIKYYRTFSPKVFSTTEPIQGRVKSRCLHFIMKQNVRVAVEDLIDQDEKGLEQAEYLRNCLTIFRANFLNKEFKKLEKIGRRRLSQIITPLYRIVIEIAPAREEEFKEIVKRLEKEKKEVKTLSLEAEIIEVFVDRAENKNTYSIGSKDLCQILNVDRSKKSEINTMNLHHTMPPLGFKKATKQPREWYIDKKTLKQLEEEYL